MAKSPARLHGRGGFRLLAHPVTMFVLLQIIWVAFVVIWVIWVVNRQKEVAELARSFGTNFLKSDQTLVTLIAGIAMLVLILIGIVGLFVWGQKQKRMMRQQRRFVSSVTHELRSPLASLKLANETLIYRQLSDEAKAKIMSLSMLDIDRLTRMVDQILISARLDRGIMLFEEDVEVLWIHDEIQELVESLKHADKDIRDRIVLNCDKKLTFKTSKTAFKLIFGNILENAFKYSPKGSAVKIDAHIVQGHLSVTIADQGVGLEPKERKRIFKMFHRSANVVRNAIPGTGLGLYIVKTAVDQMGGVIQVASEGLDRGSRFTVHIPAMQAGATP